MANDVWKSLQGSQYNRVQGRQTDRENVADTAIGSYWIRQIEKLKQKWRDGKVPLDSSEQTMTEVRRLINTCMKRNEIIKGRMADVQFSVDADDPFKFTFMQSGKSNDGISRAIIKGDDVFSEVEAVTDYFMGSYTNSEGVVVPAEITRSVHVIDCEEITESCNIKLTDRNAESEDRIENIANGMVREVLNDGCGYQERTPEKTGESRTFMTANAYREIYRTDIDPNEEIRIIGNIGDKGTSFLSQFYFQSVVETLQEPREDGKSKYGDCIPQAKQFVETCKKIYDLFMEAYRMSAHEYSKTFSGYKEKQGIDNQNLLDLIAQHSRSGNLDNVRQEMENLFEQEIELDGKGENGREDGEGEEH